MPLQSLNKAEPTLALKPRGDITRSPKQGYQWPQKWTCVQQKFKKKKSYPLEPFQAQSMKHYLLDFSVTGQEAYDFCEVLISLVCRLKIN